MGNKTRNYPGDFNHGRKTEPTRLSRPGPRLNRTPIAVLGDEDCKLNADAKNAPDPQPSFALQWSSLAFESVSFLLADHCPARANFGFSQHSIPVIQFMKKLALILTLSAVAASSLSAQLVLNIDTAAQELWFTGSDTGNTTATAVVWFSGSSGTGTSSVSTPENLVTFSSFYFSRNPRMFAYNTGNQVVFAFDSTGSESSLTLTGTGTKISYAGFDAGAITNLESQTNIPFFNGATGFSDISVSVSAVPEPGSFALFLGLATFGFLNFRRRRTV